MVSTLALLRMKVSIELSFRRNVTSFVAGRLPRVISFWNHYNSGFQGAWCHPVLPSASTVTGTGRSAFYDLPFWSCAASDGLCSMSACTPQSFELCSVSAAQLNQNSDGR